MPALTGTASRTALKVAASAPLELMWVVHNAWAEHELIGPYASQEPLRNQFGARLKEFWADGVRGFTEVVVLAHRSGTLLDLELNRFFERYDAAAGVSPVPSLLSESPLERQAVAERLRRLHDEPRLRARHRELVHELWKATEGEWNATGRRATVAAADEWSKRLGPDARVEDIKQLIERQQIWKGRPQYDAMVEQALAEGRLVLSPGWFYGDIHIVELDGSVYLGRAIRAPEREQMRRDVAAHIAVAMKALADPTRVAILLALAHESASITELARELKLSQPTVSSHVQILREAGVLEEKASGRSAILSTNEESLRRYFSAIQDKLLDFCLH
jgi:DNA-binding transcriptional ArsR family regulator